MAFAPIGFRFDVRSSDSVEQAKARINRRKKPTFSYQTGVHGFFIGRLIALTYYTPLTHGPLLLGILSSDDQGVRIKGRVSIAASGMSGLLAIPLAPLLFLVMDGEKSFENLLLFLTIFGLITLILSLIPQRRSSSWMLVRFLEETLSSHEPKDAAPPDETVLIDHQLVIDGETPVAPVTVSMVDKALRDDDAELLILRASEEVYVQCYRNEDLFLVECRRGNASEQYQAFRRGITQDTVREDNFSVDEVVAIFKAFGTGGAEPEFLEWRPMES